MTAIQLGLFEQAEPNWLNIDTNWLFNYLNNKYPDLCFKVQPKWSYFDGKGNENIVEEVVQTKYKKINCSFYIGTVDTKEYTWWQNPVLVHLQVNKKGGDYEGFGLAVNNMENFKARTNELINKCEMYANSKKEVLK